MMKGGEVGKTTDNNNNKSQCNLGCAEQPKYNTLM
jgi:hypothetical protein